MATLHFDDYDKAQHNAGADVQAGPVDVVAQCHQTAIKRFRFDKVRVPLSLSCRNPRAFVSRDAANELLSVVQCTKCVREVTQPNRMLSSQCSLPCQLPYIGSSTDL
jgi:hypothetical protein